MKNEYDKLKEKYSMLSEAYAEKEKECSKSGMQWSDFVNETRSIKTSLFETEKELRKIQPIGYEVAKNWNGKIITLEEFINDSKNGVINDDSAVYYYSDGMTKTDIRVYPSDILADIYRTDLTHVMVTENKTV